MTPFARSNINPGEIVIEIEIAYPENWINETSPLFRSPNRDRIVLQSC